MKPLVLTLQGFIGIKSGLGRDELTIHLDELSTDDKLVALIGDNGSGKSTILDNMHPYRLMPSRAGGYSPGQFSYYDHVQMGKSSKTLEWAHGGLRYKSEILFNRTPKTQKTSAYLYVQKSSGWVPVKLPNNTVSDGKSATYDECVNHIMGTPELFFTAAFSSQGKKSLTSYTNGDIKGLLSELLELDHITEMGEQAKETKKLFLRELETMRDTLARIEDQREQLTGIDVEIDDAGRDHDALHEDKGAAKQAVNKAHMHLADVRAKDREATELAIKKADLESRIRRENERFREFKAEQDINLETAEQAKSRTMLKINEHEHEIRDNNNNELLSIDRHWAEAIDNVRQQIEREEAAIRDSEVEIEKHQSILLKKDLIEGAEQKIVLLDGDKQAVLHNITDIKIKTNELSILAEKDLSIRHAMEKAADEGKVIARELEETEKRSALCAEVPCQGTDLQGKCRLLKDSFDAAKNAPEMHIDLTNKRSEYKKLSESRIPIVRQMENLRLDCAGLTDLEIKSADIDRQLNELHALAGQVEALASAESSIKYLQDKIETAKNMVDQHHQSIVDHKTQWGKQKEDAADRMDKALKELMEELEISEKEYAATIDRITPRLEAAQSDHDKAVSELTAELNTISTGNDDNALELAEEAVAQAERRLNQIESSISANFEKSGRLKERARVLREDLASSNSVTARASAIEEEIAHWSALSKALSNDGIIALIIDDAGPNLSSITNDLLLECYGPRFTISIVTQGETAKGDLKEIFDIRVFDSERNDDKSLRDMSGGEKIWIQETIARAMAVFQAQGSGRHYDCVFSDESDGALDAEKKQKFINMKRRALEIGGHDMEIFISHTPELWDMADTIINITDFRV